MPDKTLEEQARQRHEDIAKQIEREDGLIGTRTTWLLLAEALLFGGVGALAAKAAELACGEPPHPTAVGLLLGGAACLLAVASLIANRCRAAIMAAEMQLKYLREEWSRLSLKWNKYVQPFGGNVPYDHGITYPKHLAAIFLYSAVIAAGVLAFLAAQQADDKVLSSSIAFLFEAVVAGLALPPWQAPKPNTHTLPELDAPEEKGDTPPKLTGPK